MNPGVNRNQLATATEADAIALQIGTLGGGVSAIYIPEYEGPWTAPEDGASKFLHFDFACGAKGHNVGLIRTLMAQCPMRWPIMLLTELHYQVPTVELPKETPDSPQRPPVMPAPGTVGGGFPPLKPGQVMTLFGPATPIGAKTT